MSQKRPIMNATAPGSKISHNPLMKHPARQNQLTLHSYVIKVNDSKYMAPIKH